MRVTAEVTSYQQIVPMSTEWRSLVLIDLGCLEAGM